jgi:hypothetical protein
MARKRFQIKTRNYSLPTMWYITIVPDNTKIFISHPLIWRNIRMECHIWV